MIERLLNTYTILRTNADGSAAYISEFVEKEEAQRRLGVFLSEQIDPLVTFTLIKYRGDSND